MSIRFQPDQRALYHSNIHSGAGLNLARLLVAALATLALGPHHLDEQQHHEKADGGPLDLRLRKNARVLLRGLDLGTRGTPVAVGAAADIVLQQLVHQDLDVPRRKLGHN